MASKAPKKLIDIQKKLKTYSIRIGKFFKHKLLAQRKTALIVGGDSLPQFKDSLLTKLAKTWILTQVKIHKDLQVKFQNNKPEFNRVYIPQSQRLHQYKAVEDLLKGKHFDAIIVLPDKVKSGIDPENDQFLGEYNPVDTMFNSLFGYRLAHKYLSTSGVLILSSSQQDFIKEENQQKYKQYLKQQQTQQKKIQTKQQQSNSQQTGKGVTIKLVQKPQRISPSKYIKECQNNYLGVLIGDRDYTDLNSWSVIGLTEQIAQTDPEYVSNMYRNWAQGTRIPMPGSFALFKRKIQDLNKCSHVEYL